MEGVDLKVPTKWLTPLIVVALVGLLMAQCYLSGRRDTKAKQERESHQRTTDSLTALLKAGNSRVDTLTDTLKVQKLRTVHDSVRVLVRDSAIVRADSGIDSLKMIRTRDTAIAARDTL